MPGFSGHAREHPVPPDRDVLVVRASEHDLQRPAVAAKQSGAHEGRRAHARDRGQFAAQRRNDLGGRLVAPVPVLEEDDGLAGIHVLAGAEEARHPRVHALDRLVFAGQRREQGFHLEDLRDGVVVARAFRRLDRDEENAAILAGRELLVDYVEQHDARDGAACEDGAEDDRPADSRRDLAAIAVRQPGEPPVDPGIEAARLRVRADQLRAHHRRQRKRDEAGNRDRTRERDRELAEQPPGIAFHEADRQEDRDQDDRGRDHRECDLRRSAARGNERRFPEVRAALDVLDDHDRVVHDEADAQHDRQQCQQVDRESEGP